MKRLFALLMGMFLILMLTACDEEPYIEPDVITVVYENIRFEGTSVIIDIWITNGTDNDYSFDYVEFWVEFPEGTAQDFVGDEREFCGAGFYFNELVEAGGYLAYEIEFTSEYVQYAEGDVTTRGLTLNDLELYYWFEE